jgi:uncharacterized repeat protein (TIGR03803 family)
VFKLTTKKKVETVLYNFTGGADGSGPGSLIIDGQGNLYGTTESGGGGICTYGCGTVFKVTSTGTFTVIYAFGGGTDSGNPSGPLILDQQGNLYGATSGEYSYDNGTVFKLTP